MANNKKKTQKELRADFASISAMKEYAETQVRKLKGSNTLEEAKACVYLAQVEAALKETGALIK